MSVFVNDGGVEKEAKMIYVNDGGIDKLVAGAERIDFALGEVWVPLIVGAARFNSIVVGGDTFVAVGDGGQIFSKKKGGPWTQRTSGTSSNLNCVVHGNDTFVAVGSGGVTLTSPDGENWVQRNSGTSADINSVAYGNELFVTSAPIGRSSDGVTWIRGSTGTSGTIITMSFGNGEFVGVRSSNVTLYRSANGQSFQSVATTGLGTGSINCRHFYSDELGLWMASGRAGYFEISPNGQAWTTRAAPGGLLRRVMYKDEFGLAAGSSGTLDISNNGSSWRETNISGFAGLGNLEDVAISVDEMWACGGPAGGPGYLVGSAKSFWG